MREGKGVTTIAASGVKIKALFRGDFAEGQGEMQMGASMVVLGAIAGNGEEGGREWTHGGVYVGGLHKSKQSGHGRWRDSQEKGAPLCDI